ncbi:MAG: UDP-3-O-acyl-N-acetylglucosamine deacetylase, partial [Deltaproteobacteria bacterium]
MDYKQRTLKKEAECTGVGLHSGEKSTIVLRPALPNTGIQFCRSDLPKRPTVRAQFDQVADTMLATTIGINGCKIGTIEHLMAAFYGLGIDNVHVEVDGPEVPIMDGSSAPFIYLIKTAGIEEQKAPKKFLVIKRRFELKDGNRSVSIRPSNELKITYFIDFPHPLLRKQEYELRFSGRDFVREISTARTFGFLKDIQMLKDNGLARGGSLDNAIVLDDFRILNNDGLRFKDEFVRHKILDFIGDLSIIGYPVIGHFMVKRSGHFLNHQMFRTLMENRKYWEIVSFKNPEECTGNTVKIPAFG